MKRTKKQRTPARPFLNAGRREFIKVGGLAALSLGIPAWSGCGDDGAGGDGGGGDAGVDSPTSDAARREPFTLVALPDTQVYSDELPAVYTAQTRWIVDNAAKENIVFVTHLGDVVDNGPSQRQWDNARASMSLLDAAGVPYGVCLGNHDLQYSDSEFQYPPTVNNACSHKTDFDCDASHFLENFGPQRFSRKPWYGGASPSGLSSFQKVQVPGGIELLFLHVALDFPAAELSWAQGVLDDHPRAAVHVTTHRYLYDYRLVKGMPFPLSKLLGGRSTELNYLLDDALFFEDSITASRFYATFVAPNPNIFMVQCGHVDAEFYQVSENVAGLAVHEMLADYQQFDYAEEGWMRLLRFDLDAKKVHVRTYSPVLDAYRENGAGLDASLQALEMGFGRLIGQYGELIDAAALRETLDYWGKTTEGRAEYAQLLYGEGQRDSDFEIALDLESYVNAR